MATFQLRTETGALYLPTPAQAAFHGARTRDGSAAAPFKWFVGGYGAGKSACGAAEALACAIQFPGSRGLVGMHSYRMLKSTAWKTMVGMLSQSCPQLIRKHNESEPRLELANGSEILGWNADGAAADTMRSLNLSWIWFDEIQLIAPEIFDQALGRLRHASAPWRLWGTGNPRGENWTWNLFVKERLNDHVYVVGKTKDNPHNPPGFAARLYRRYSPEDQKRYLEGEFLAFQGAVFSEFRPETHVIRPIALDRRLPRFLGVDPGRKDECAALWAAVTEAGDLVVYREYAEAGRLISENAQAIRQLSGNDPVVWTAIDPWDAGRESTESGIRRTDLWRQAGLSVIEAPRTPKLTAIEQLRELIHPDPERPHPFRSGQTGAPRFYVTEDCPRLIQELKNWAWKDPQTAAQALKPEPEDGNDHLIAALRFLIARRPQPPAAPAEVNTYDRFLAICADLDGEPARDRERESLIGNG